MSRKKRCFFPYATCPKKEINFHQKKMRFTPQKKSCAAYAKNKNKKASYADFHNRAALSSALSPNRCPNHRLRFGGVFRSPFIPALPPPWAPQKPCPPSSAPTPSTRDHSSLGVGQSALGRGFERADEGFGSEEGGPDRGVGAHGSEAGTLALTIPNPLFDSRFCSCVGGLRPTTRGRGGALTPSWPPGASDS